MASGIVFHPTKEISCKCAEEAACNISVIRYPGLTEALVSRFSVGEVRVNQRPYCPIRSSFTHRSLAMVANQHLEPTREGDRHHRTINHIIFIQNGAESGYVLREEQIIIVNVEDSLGLSDAHGTVTILATPARGLQPVMEDNPTIAAGQAGSKLANVSCHTITNNHDLKVPYGLRLDRSHCQFEG